MPIYDPFYDENEYQENDCPAGWVAIAGLVALLLCLVAVAIWFVL